MVTYFKKEEWLDRDSHWISLIPQNTERWQLLHHGRITGRFAAIAAGHICYTEADKPENLALKIIGKTAENDVGESYVGESYVGAGRDKEFESRILLGNKTEAILKPWYEKTQKKKISEIGLAVWKRDPFIGASPDGLIESKVEDGKAEDGKTEDGKIGYSKIGDGKAEDGKGIIEIKYKGEMPSTLQFQAKVSNGEISKTFAHIPRRDFDQMQHTMGVLGREFCDYIVLSPKVGIYTERIPFNQEFFDSLIEKYNAFKETYLLPLIEKYDVKVIPPDEDYKYIS